jgi:hypothetical protein
MFTIRNVGGVALFLFGTTFLWLTPSFASRRLQLPARCGRLAPCWRLPRSSGSRSPRGAVPEGLLVVRRHGRSRGSRNRRVGPLPLAARHAGETTPQFNVFIHAVADAGVFILLLVPRLEHWVSGHVVAGH